MRISRRLPDEELAVGAAVSIMARIKIDCARSDGDVLLCAGEVAGEGIVVERHEARLGPERIAAKVELDLQPVRAENRALGRARGRFARRRAAESSG